MKLDIRKSDLVEMDKGSLNGLVPVVKGFAKDDQDRFPPRGKRFAHAQTLAVVKQLLGGGRSEQGWPNDGTAAQRAASYRQPSIPGSSNFLPGFSSPGIAILNDHPVTAQIAQTLDPYILKCRY